jgi:hypothetical protein
MEEQLKSLERKPLPPMTAQDLLLPQGEPQESLYIRPGLDAPPSPQVTFKPEDQAVAAKELLESLTPSPEVQALREMEDPDAPGFFEDPVSSRGRKLGKEGRKQQQEARPKNLTFWQEAVTDASISMVMTGEAATLAFLTKNPNVMALGFGAGEMARGYDEAKSAGKSKAEALRYAMINGVIEAGTEYLPAKTLFKVGSKPFKRMANVLAHEMVGENVAEVTQKLNAHIHGLDDNVTAQDFLDTIKKTSASTLIGASVQSGVASGIHKLAERQQGRKAQEKLLGKMLLEQVEGTEFVEGPAMEEEISFAEEADIDYQTAYHGSPHKFDEFSLDAVGSGEGAQAYGWGLYFAGEKEVGEFYRQSLENVRDNLKGEKHQLEKMLSHPRSVTAEKAKQIRKRIVKLNKAIANSSKEGFLYEVLIPNDSDLLSWDAPLSEQPNSVLNKMRGDNKIKQALASPLETEESLKSYSGRNVYEALSSEVFSTAKEASEYLSSIGIKGLSYWDAGSRRAGRGSKNYVIWDDSTISVEAVNEELRQAEIHSKQKEISKAEPLAKEEKVSYQQAAQQIDKAEPGQTYKGMIPETEGAAGPVERGATANAVRREQVIAPLLKALNVPLYQGKGKMKGSTLGYFIPQKEVVRVKKMSDIEVVGHELAHLVDKRVFGYGRGRPWLKNKTFTKELKGLSYDKNKTHEGFAEFVRHWMTNPEAAQGAAPNFFNWWEQWVESHEYGPALRSAQQGMTGWFNQSRQARAASKVGRAPDVNEWNTSRVDDLRQRVMDDLNGLLLAEQAITKRSDALPGGPYERARNMRGARATMDGVLMYGPPVWSEGKMDFRSRDGLPSTRIVQEKGKSKIKETPGWKPWGLRDVLDPVADQLDDFLLYAVGKRADMLRGEGREKLFSKAEIQGMLDLETPIFKAVHEDYQKWNKAIVDFAVEYGQIIPKDVAKKFDHLNYIPFYRVGTARGGKKSKIQGDVSVIHRLTGGTSNLNDLLDNMILNAEKLVVESIKNRARMETIDFIDKSGISGHFFEQVPKSAVPVGVDKEQVINEFIKGLGLEPRDVNRARSTGQVSSPSVEAALEMVDLFEENLADHVQFWQHGRPPGGKNLVAVLRNGKPTYYEVIDPLLYRSFESFSRRNRGAIARFLGKTRRFGQSTVTLTLEFLTANMWRDTWHGWAFSKHGFKPILGTLEGMTHRITHDSTYRQFLANGGGLASMYTDPEEFETNLKGFYHGKGIDFKTVVNPRNWIRGIMLLADAAEMSTRLGEYSKGIEKGEVPSTAIYGSREISTDFGMRGDDDYVNLAYDSIIFLKAAANGMDRAYRGFVKDENRMSIALKTSAIAMTSVLLALYNMTDEDDWYNDLEDWDKNAHWHVKPGDTHLRFPKIWEIGGIASLAERVLEAYLKDDYGDLWKQAGQIILDQMKMEYLPYIAAPLVEVYGLNRNRFTERPIETVKMQELDPALRYRTGTSEFSRAVGEGMLKADIPMEVRDKLSPARVDALVKGYLNTWGMYGLMLSDEAMGKERPERRPWEYPVLRRFMSPKVPRHTRYTSSFWDFCRRSSLYMNSIREAAKQARPDYFERFIKGVEEHKGRASENVARALSGYSKEMEQIRTDKSLSPKEKAEALDIVQERYNDLTKQFMIEHGGMK